jgi:hypothetical protein
MDEVLLDEVSKGIEVAGADELGVWRVVDDMVWNST